MKNLLPVFVLFLVASGADAQSFNYEQQNTWSESPERHIVNSNFTLASAVGILDDRNVEYKMEGKEINLYTTYHRIFEINDDKGIEMFNKIYIPVFANWVVYDLKARTVLSNGKVLNVPADKVKEIEENGSVYKLFAMEGVEKGAEIEYTYSVKRPATFFGTETFQSSSTPYQKVCFTLSAPSYLKFDAKGFNGIKVSSDSLIGEKRVIVGFDENVTEIDDEKYAVRAPYLKRIEYKLSYNLSSNADVRLYTWKEFAKRAFSIYTTVNAKEEKPLISLISSIKPHNIEKLEGKISAIEDYIKSSINIDKNLIGEDASAFDKILKRKSSDNQGIIRLFSALFDKARVNYQIVFVGRRDEASLDEDLENWNRVDETVFYFPDTRKYLSPTSVDFRYPFIPPYWAGAKGLFLRGVAVGSFKTAIGSFGQIDMQPFENSAHNMEVNVKFDETMDTLLIYNRQILTGYGAANYRPVYAFLSKEKQDEASIEIVKSVVNSTDITNIKVENSLLTDYKDNKPFSISADIKSTNLTERAGNKILLKIGEIIGPQAQMYQEKRRMLPVELPYPHGLNRKIFLQIPNGFKVKNLDDLKMSVEPKDGGESTMGFTSTYSENGNIITINVNESYKKYRYPLSQFEDFKKVINASADFNKVVLVLEKK